jgi:hypothetical protein
VNAVGFVIFGQFGQPPNIDHVPSSVPSSTRYRNAQETGTPWSADAGKGVPGHRSGSSWCLGRVSLAVGNCIDVPVITEQVAVVLMHHARVGMAQPPCHLHIADRGDQQVAGKAVPHAIGSNRLTTCRNDPFADLLPDTAWIVSVRPRCLCLAIAALHRRLQQVPARFAQGSQDGQQSITDRDVPGFAVLGDPAVVRDYVRYRTSFAGLGVARIQVDVLPPLHDGLFHPQAEETADIDDDLRLEAIRRLIVEGQSPRDEADRRLIRAFAARWSTQPRSQIAASLVHDRLRRLPELRQELAEVLTVLKARRGLKATDQPLTATEPLAVHAHYEREELLCLLGNWTDELQPPWREGIRYLEASRTDILVVTLEKTEHRFSPQVRYKDYVINRDLFHWQSQNATGPDSPSGQRLVSGLSDGQPARHLLFVRRTYQDAFQFLGSLTHVASEGTKPMSITWRVTPAMPMELVEGLSATG